MYNLRIYGLPRVDDEEWDGEAKAIQSARRHLKVGHFAELREKMTSRVVWTAYVAADGSIVETRRDREPGSD